MAHRGKPPILFKRFPNQLPQVLPVRGGDLRKLRWYVRLNNPTEELLLLLWVVAAFIPGIAHAVLALLGDAGAAKTFTQERLKELIDPCRPLTAAPPRFPDDFVQQASHNWVYFMDNLSTLPAWLSDSLCRLATGAGFVKGKLYTDDDDMAYDLKSVTGFSSVSQIIWKPDLLNRNLIFELGRFPKDQQIPESKLIKAFANARPRLLGTVFDALSSAMAIRPTLHLPELPRLGDFAEHGEAIAQALGYQEGEFLLAYDGNIKTQNQFAISESPIWEAIIALMKRTPVRAGTASELLGELNQLAVTHYGIDNTVRGWPRTASWLMRGLQQIKPNLASVGITVEVDRTGPSRNVRLTSQTTPDG